MMSFSLQVPMPVSMLTSLPIAPLLVVLVLLTMLWVLSVWWRDASIIDPCWGVGFVVIAWLAFAIEGTGRPRAILLVALATVWGLRLTGYLLWRNRGKGEDYRYRAMREKNGERFWIVSLFTVFWLQAVIMWVVSFPLQYGQRADTPLSWLDALGVILFAIGLYFETVGDWQLAAFKSDPANQGQVLNAGLWRYTRHPNYFGDFCVWWGLYLIASAGGAWWTAFSPLVMSFFLLKVSGVAMLESTIVERRPKYAEYIRRTSAFFPRPPVPPEETPPE
jgi:steroid 5-alpha reductase family enzyme